MLNFAMQFRNNCYIELTLEINVINRYANL